MMSKITLVLLSVAFGLANGVAAAAQQQQQQAGAAAGAGTAAGVMVVEMDLTNENKVDAKVIAKVFADLGAEEAKVAPLLKRLGTAGDKALVTAGSKESCEMVAKKLTDIGMKVEIRPLAASDVPSMAAAAARSGRIDGTLYRGTPSPARAYRRLVRARVVASERSAA